MKPDIIRQPLLLAIASLLVVIAAAMTTGTVISPAPETVISTPLGDLIGLFQERFPRCSRIFCGSLLLLTGILCGRLAVRYGLYPVSSTLTIPLYGLVACGILLGREYLTESVTAFILLLSTQSFFACFRNGYAIGAVFRASFFLGLLPLLYAPLLPLPLLILAAAFCFRRTLREVFVSLCGVILPFLAVCYVAWGQGANPVDIPRRLMALLRQRQRIPDFRQYSSACPRNSRDRPFYRTLRRIFRTHQFPCDKYQSTGHADLYHPALHGDGKPDGGTERHPGAAGRRSRTCSTAHAPDLHSHPTHRRNAPVPCFVFRLHCKYIAIKSASNVEIVHILTFSI